MSRLAWHLSFSAMALLSSAMTLHAGNSQLCWLCAAQEAVSSHLGGSLARLKLMAFRRAVCTRVPASSVEKSTSPMEEGPVSACMSLWLQSARLRGASWLHCFACLLCGLAG